MNFARGKIMILRRQRKLKMQNKKLKLALNW
jgi:hypothetical protein